MEQAVEDVVRLLRSNRRAALLIVQLVYKFQCERGEGRAAEQHPAAEQQPAEQHPLVVLDESEDEETVQSRPPSKRPKPKKGKQRKPGKKDKNFAAVMEDIFHTVISDPSAECAAEPLDCDGLDADFALAQGAEPGELFEQANDFLPAADPVYQQAQFPQSAPPAAAAQLYGAEQAVGFEQFDLHSSLPAQPAAAFCAPKPDCFVDERRAALLQRRKSLCQQLQEVDMQERELGASCAPAHPAAHAVQCEFGGFGAPPSPDFDDIMDLIRDGGAAEADGPRPPGQPAFADADCAQATHAIFQDLILTDNQFQLATPCAL